MSNTFDRRTFLRLAAASAGALSVPIGSEFELAHAQMPQTPKPGTAGAVLINYNENPLGPSATARAAVMDVLPQGGRYYGELTEALVTTFAKQNGLRPEYVLPYAGSTEPLQYAVLAFTGPGKSLIVADPTYEQPVMAAGFTGAAVHKIPLTPTYAHDIDAMLAADANAGLIYICNPNNPSGTITPREAIEHALANKPAGSILLVDEAYIHFSNEPSVVDLVAADKDIIVLRTFSKLYGMAGLRLGFAIARPDLLKKLAPYGQNAIPITSAAAGTASLKDPHLIASRKLSNGTVRDDTLAWLKSKGYAVTPSQSNCFMVDVKQPTKPVVLAMAGHQVYIGRSWPIWPSYARITVGTAAEMARFKAAFEAVMSKPAAVARADIQASRFAVLS